MKNFYIFSVLFALSGTLSSQIIGFRDLGVLFSKENYNGTARYNAMSGAFGALGGDISSIYQNPAGAAVFSKSEISGTYSVSSLDTDATYYGETSNSTNTSSRFPQFGMVVVVDSPYANSNWTKFTLGFNYSMLNDFRGNYSTIGNNNSFVRYDLHPYDSDATLYNNPEEQYFENTTHGKSEVYTFSFSSAYKDFFYIGSSLNFNTIEVTQDTFLSEYNSNNNGQTLTADYSQFITEKSTGVSLGIGMIIKPFRNLRLGLAYQSPVWHPEVNEDSNLIDYDQYNEYTGFQEQGYLDIDNRTNGFYQNTSSNYPQLDLSQYSLSTPEKWTASAAITIGQHGLISVDYHRKNYSSLSFQNSPYFSDTNEEIRNILTTANGLRGGVELRFNQISLRGGAFTEESPYKNEEGDIYKKGISFGLGLKFKHAKLDFAYQHKETEDQYAIYHSSEPVENITLLNTTDRITSTLSFTF